MAASTTSPTRPRTESHLPLIITRTPKLHFDLIHAVLNTVVGSSLVDGRAHAHSIARPVATMSFYSQGASSSHDPDKDHGRRPAVPSAQFQTTAISLFTKGLLLPSSGDMMN
jgi:hypothetical protein